LKEILVLPKKLFRLTGLIVLCLGSCPAFSQQFSADMIRQKPEGTQPSKVAVKGEKIRFAMTGQQPQQESIVVIDLKQETGFMILPDNKSYTPLASKHISTAMPFFLAEDPEDACAAWDKFVSKPGSCSKVGDETIDDRAVVKYKGIARNGDTGYAWVDKKLKFVTKWEGEKGAVSFKNIQEGPQAAAMFTIPSGFERMDSMATHQSSAKKKPGKPMPRAARPANPAPTQPASPVPAQPPQSEGSPQN
jgi:hypothetical protein